MFTAPQLVAHLVGDYLLQSHDMATRKISNFWYALYHALWYAVPFVFIVGFGWHTIIPIGLIVLTHAIIDRTRIPRLLIVAKNYMWPIALNKPYDEKGELISPNINTGYPKNMPDWMQTNLYILTDNICHILLNGLILYLFMR